MTPRQGDPKDLWVSRSSGASLSKGTLAPLSCVGTAGKVWEGENPKFGICFSEKPFNLPVIENLMQTDLSQEKAGSPEQSVQWRTSFPWGLVELKLMPQGLASLWLDLVFLCIWVLFFNFVVAKKGQQLHLSSSSYMPHGEHCLFLF